MLCMLPSTCHFASSVNVCGSFVLFCGQRCRCLSVWSVSPPPLLLALDLVQFVLIRHLL